MGNCMCVPSGKIRSKLQALKHVPHTVRSLFEEHAGEKGFLNVEDVQRFLDSQATQPMHLLSRHQLNVVSCTPLWDLQQSPDDILAFVISRPTKGIGSSPAQTRQLIAKWEKAAAHDHPHLHLKKPHVEASEGQDQLDLAGFYALLLDADVNAVHDVSKVRVMQSLLRWLRMKKVWSKGGI